MMFTITFENEIYQQWSCEFVFNTLEDAKKYLINQGFAEKSGYFERNNYNWIKYTKAYVSPRKVYSAEGG